MHVLGIDPGVNLGLVVARRRDPSERYEHSYVIVHHLTVKTEPEMLVGDRIGRYCDALTDVCALHEPNAAFVEVPWRRVRGRNALSVYTRGQNNVGSLALLCAITGSVLATLHKHSLSAKEVPAPIGIMAQAWEKQKEHETKMVYGVELKKHEAVAAMLALKGL